MIDLRHGDCLEVLKTIPDKSIDLVVTDCPYRIVQGGCTNIPRQDEPSGIFNRRSTFTQANAKSGKLFDNNDIEFKDWLPDVYRVLKDDTHCYIMINARNLKDLQQEAENVGFKFQNILMLRKGKAKNINNMGCKNIIDIKNIKGGKLHPTEKPVELNKFFIENSSAEGDLILDPFMGAGSCACACKELNRNFIGIEIDEKYFNIAYDRINNTSNIFDDLD